MIFSLLLFAPESGCGEKRGAHKSIGLWGFMKRKHVARATLRTTDLVPSDHGGRRHRYAGALPDKRGTACIG